MNKINLNIFENCILKEDKNNPSYYILSPNSIILNEGIDLSQISIFDINRGTVFNDKQTIKKTLNILMSNKHPFEKEKELKELNLSNQEKRAIGTMLGMAIGDAMGSRYKNYPLRYGVIDLVDIGHSTSSNLGLEPGQWTNNTSMGLCLADSLLMNNGILDPHDLMHRLLCLWKGGYNNSFRFNHFPRKTLDFSEDIESSLYFYINYKYPQTRAGNKDSSGNGSLVRNAAIPICYFNDIQFACEMAKQQSLTTHQGLEAKECCSLITYIIVKIFNGKRLNDILNDMGDRFTSSVKSVKYLAKSLREGNDENRDWNWKIPQYFYSSERSKLDPSSIGFYSMDNMAMSLNILYNTENFKQAIIKAVNIRGDSNSLACVVGQIAGAYYPIEEIPGDWIRAVYNWDIGEIALRGYMLARLKDKKSFIIDKNLLTFNLNNLSIETNQNLNNKEENIENKTNILKNITKINFSEYEIIDKLGEGGGHAPVYKILNKEDNKYYAMKVFSIKDEDINNIQKVKREAEILSKFNSDNIVKFYSTYMNKENFYIFMEYCDGKDLATLIRENKKAVIAFEEEDLLSIIKQICSSIKEIHDKKIIHRDLNPNNIMIIKNKIKIIDFGISKQLDSYKKTITNGIGTLYYMSPEQLKNEDYNEKVDIWALGCIIYELFTLNNYYIDKMSDSILPINYPYNDKWQKLVNLLLQAKPNRRPNINQVIDFINNIKIE